MCQKFCLLRLFRPSCNLRSILQCESEINGNSGSCLKATLLAPSDENLFLPKHLQRALFTTNINCAKTKHSSPFSSSINHGAIYMYNKSALHRRCRFFQDRIVFVLQTTFKMVQMARGCVGRFATQNCYIRYSGENRKVLNSRTGLLPTPHSQDHMKSPLPICDVSFKAVSEFEKAVE